jgi:hypothetical protein
MQQDLNLKMHGDPLFITTVNHYLNEEVDPDFLKQQLHSAWDIALSSDAYGQLKQSSLNNCKMQQQKALT